MNIPSKNDCGTVIEDKSHHFQICHYHFSYSNSSRPTTKDITAITKFSCDKRRASTWGRCPHLAAQFRLLVRTEPGARQTEQ